MREHEVPTHVQAEDRVLLWFTFPQIVAMVAVCALSYGVYRYAPLGPSELRMGLAVLFGLFGIAMVVGKIAGRRLPLVVADLLRYRLGPRLYVGPVSQLVRKRSSGAGATGQEPKKPIGPDVPACQAERAAVEQGDGVGASSDPAEEPERRQPPERADALPTPPLVPQRSPAALGEFEQWQGCRGQQEAR